MAHKIKSEVIRVRCTKEEKSIVDQTPNFSKEVRNLIKRLERRIERKSKTKSA